METEIIIIAIAVTLLISWAIAQFFGRSKHIGFGWTFAISATTMFIGGIIALMASPSAKGEPTEGTKAHKIFAIIFFVFGILNVIQIFISKGQMGYLAPTFFILGLYLLELSNSRILNDNPKYYFQGTSNFTFNKKEEQTRHINTKETTMDVQHSEELNFQKQKENLKNLREKGLLSEKELQEKNLKVTNQELTVELQKTEEYQQLSELYKAKVLESREFEEKVENLKLILKEAKSKNSQTTQEYQSKYNIIGEFVEGFAMVWDEEGNYGFIDYEDNLIITPRFEFAEEFCEGLALVRLNDKFGYIDTKGNITISLVYDDASSFKNGIANVRIGKEKFKIDKNGFKRNI